MESRFEAELLVHFAEDWLSEHKKTRFAEILNQRTRQLTVVLENIFQPHNASAVIRSCDAFGLQDLHVIERSNPFRPNKEIALGSERWISLHRHPRSSSCVAQLQQDGFALVATSPHTEMELADLPVDRPLALLFGEEEPGLSEELMEAADHRVRIPMRGFAESFNISVSVALCLYDLSTRLRRERQDWGLSEDDKRRLELDWCRQSITNAEEIERRFRDRWKP